MRFLELWRISKPLYYDLILSEFVQRRGGNVEKVVRSVRFNAISSKIILTIFMVLIGVYSAQSLIDVSAFFLMMLFIVSFFFLHTMTTFVSKGFEILKTLPLSEDEIAKIRLMTLFRVFDWPLISVTVAFPVAMVWFHGVEALLPSLLCILSVEVISVFLSLRFARFFYERVVYSTGSVLSAILRTITYIAWSIAFVGIYAISSIFSFLSKIRGFEGIVYKFEFVYPFNYSLLSSGVFDPVVLLSSLPIFVLSFYALRLSIREALVESKITFKTAKFRIKRTNPMIAFLKKDFRLVTRNPGFFVIVVIPVVEAFLFGRIIKPKTTFDSFLAISIVLSFTPMIPFILVGLESWDLLATLPFKRRQLRLAKTLFGCVIYGLSAFVMLPNVVSFLILPAVFATFTIGLSVAESLGATRNVYVGLWKALAVIVLCYTTTFIPILSGMVALMIGANVWLAVLIPSLLEFFVSFIFLMEPGG